MTKREYKLLNKAIHHLMEDEPLDKKDEATYGGGFTTGMDILDDMRIAHRKRSPTTPATGEGMGEGAR